MSDFKPSDLDDVLDNENVIDYFNAGRKNGDDILLLVNKSTGNILIEVDICKTKKGNHFITIEFDSYHDTIEGSRAEDFIKEIKKNHKTGKGYGNVLYDAIIKYCNINELPYKIKSDI